jgi:peptidoglycan hydrolase-like protein with peptidoglycan-binding domain
MNRAIVLVLCLTAAGGIAVYTQYSGGDTGEPVYTVPPRPADPGPKSSAAAPPKPIEPGDRAGLTRELQRELKRVGCYGGEITGVWTTSSRMAMKAFIERVNATLPIDSPDAVLLSLVQAHRQRACGAPCPAGQAAAPNGACLPNAVLAKAAKAAKEPAEPKADADKPGATVPAAGTAAALALAAPPGTPKASPKASPPDGARPAAASPSGPVPPEGMRERRPRTSAEAAPPPRPPKVVRDVLKALGF